MPAETCLKKLIPIGQKLYYVEIGVLRATNLLAIADAFPLLDIVGIDSYESYLDSAHGYSVSKELSAYNKHIAEQKIQRSEHKDRIKLVVKDSCLAAKEVKNNSIDVVFLDKNFSEESVMQDIFDWYPKVSAGGILCGHDAHTEEILFGAKKALSNYAIDSVSVIDSEVWWVKKL